jgi:hypothetical protein
MPTTVQGGAESLKGSHSMENERNLLKKLCALPFKEDLIISITFRNLSPRTLPLKQCSVNSVNYFSEEIRYWRRAKIFLKKCNSYNRIRANFQVLRSAEKEHIVLIYFDF